jgi:hypothetical protein
MREMRMAYRIFAGNPQRKRLHGIHKRGLAYTINTDLKEICCDVLDMIRLAQDGVQW